MSEDFQKRLFARNLAYYVNLSGKSQKEIADRLGISPQVLNTWVRGVALPRMGKVQLLADYFGIQKSDLIEDKGQSDRFQPLTAAELDHMREYRRLDETDQNRIDERISVLLESDKYRKKDGSGIA